ncbi:glycosyltransferase, partial [Paracraurococcus ruber]
LRAEQAGLPAPWRLDWRVPRSRAAAEARWAQGIGAALPREPLPDRRDIAFLLPLFAFGGLEKVAMAQARVLRRHGWRTHLVVAGAQRLDWAPEVAASFDSVTLFQGLGEQRVAYEVGYFGAALSRMPEDAEGARDALGLLADCQVVVNTHAIGCHALAAPLRRLGVRTFAALHLVENAAWDAPYGNPHALAGYEHAYDGILVISEALRGWCIGQGLPREKLTLLRNAPGHATPPARSARAAEDLDALYAWADVLVLPSRFEGVPLVVLEAQRMGCVPLATDVGALGEAVAHGEDGLLVPGTLPEEAIIAGFVDALRALAADRARLLALGERAAARAGALEWDVTMRPWLDRLDALVPLPGAEAAPVQARPAAA